MRWRKYISIYQLLLTGVFVLLMCASMVAQVTSTKPPNPNITAPGPQRHEPAGGQRPTNPPSIANAPPPNTALMQYPGDVEGFVYWDASVITHKPAGTCNGLAVSVTPAGSTPNPIPTGSHFKYAGQVKEFLAGGKIAVYEVCIYAYDHQPVGPQLQAQLMVTDRNAFSQATTSKPATVAPITIINAQCNMLPPIVPSSMADLMAHWGSCQNRAYDVNFALVPAFQVMNSGGGSGGGMLSNVNKGAVNPGPIQSSSRGMLSSVNPGPQQSPSPGMLASARNAGPISPPSSGTKGELLPRKAGESTLTNADVIGLLNGGVPESAIINQIKSSNKKFDFSPISCQTLAQAKVSPKIIDAMGDGSVRPCFTGEVRSGTGNGADDLNPQPFPPKGVQVFRSASSSPGINSSPAQVLSARSSQSGATPTNTRVPVTASSNTGEISGFIYWDPAKTKFPSTCEKVEVRASLDHGSWTSWQGGAGNLTYSSNGSLTVCAYTITGAPIGIPLDIVPSVSWPYMAFGVNVWSLASPGNQIGGAVAWGGEILGEYDVITIEKTSCDVSVTSKMSSSQSNLESGPRSCGNQAVNVNLILSSNPPPLNGSNTAGSNAGSRSGAAPTMQTQPRTNF